MRAFTKILAAVALLIGLLGPAPAGAGVAVRQCAPTDLGCIALGIDPNHICYVPNCPCGPSVFVFDLRYDPPRPTVAPVLISMQFNASPVDGPPRGFIPVQGARLSIPPGAPAGYAEFQVLQVPQRFQERVRVEIYNAAPVTILNAVSDVLISVPG